MCVSRFLRSVLLLAIAPGVLAERIESIERQTVEGEYDFIICGGGTAGLVLANRLTESGKNRVLVLEAGPTPEIVAAYATPGGNQLLGGTAIDWAFYTEPQEHLDGRILPYHRGRGLGGSSATNGLFYGRGTSTIYDAWVELGNPGWSFDEVWPFFVKGTHFNPPDASKGFDMSYKTWAPENYADDGPLELAFQGYVPGSAVAFVEACSEAANVPIVEDLNSGNGTGVKQGTGTLDAHLRRSSSYDAYYKPVAGRENLDLLYYAPVQYIIFEEGGEKPKAIGVGFIDHPSGLVYEVHAGKEVIVSMGAFHSPQLLMISGIGPSSQLEDFGIEPVVINENVGQQCVNLPSQRMNDRAPNTNTHSLHSLNDHSVFSIMATTEPEFSTTQVLANFTNLRAAQEEFYSHETGPYTAPSGITNAFQMLSNEELEEIGAGAVIEAGLTGQAHIEYLYESVFYPGGPTPYYIPKGNESYISLTASSMVALSRGNVTIRSSSMADYPVVNPNYYAHLSDRAVAIQSFKYLRKILNHPRLAEFHTGEVSPGSDVADDDDDAIFEYVKAITIPNWHASGTNQMLPLEDGGVVDPRLRVYGVDSLRVVDCSILPRLPDVNILGPVYMVAEKGAEMIREDWDDE